MILKKTNTPSKLGFQGNFLNLIKDVYKTNIEEYNN